MTLCSWCDDVIIPEAAAKPAAGVSHGLCRSCLQAALARAAARPGPTPTFALPKPAPAPVFARA